MIKLFKQFILIFEFVLFFFPQCGYGSRVEECLRSIPEEDTRILDNFFGYMISYEYFGYVLFGSKPIAAGGFDTHFTVENALSEGSIKQRRLRLGWQTWKKYASLFPTQKFILRLSKNPISPSFYWIVLINRETCLQCIESNWEIFKSALGNEVTPHSIVDSLATKEDIFEEVLNKQHRLLGILFGYGTHNSILFQKQHEIFKAIKAIYSKGKQSGVLAKKLLPFNRYSPHLVAIDLPRFAEDPDHADASKLHVLYESTWKKLAQIYTGKNFFEITMEKLTENISPTLMKQNS